MASSHELWLDFFIFIFCLCLVFQSVSVAVGVRSLHHGERDARRPVHDLRTAATRHGRVHAARQPDVASFASQYG